MFANEQSTQESSISSAEAKADLEKGMAVSGVENSTEAKQETQNTEKTSENSEDDKISIPETARDSKEATKSSTQDTSSELPEGLRNAKSTRLSDGRISVDISTFEELTAAFNTPLVGQVNLTNDIVFTRSITPGNISNRNLVIDGKNHTINFSNYYIDNDEYGYFTIKNLHTINGGDGNATSGVFDLANADVTIENVTHKGNEWLNARNIELIGNIDVTVEGTGNGYTNILSVYWTRNGSITVKSGATVNLTQNTQYGYGAIVLPHCDAFTIEDNATVSVKTTTPLGYGVLGNIKNGMPINIGSGSKLNIESTSPSTRGINGNLGSINISKGGELNVKTASDYAIAATYNNATINLSGAKFNIQSTKSNGLPLYMGSGGSISFDKQNVRAWLKGFATATDPQYSWDNVTGVVNMSGANTTSALSNNTEFNALFKNQNFSRISSDGRATQELTKTTINEVKDTDTTVSGKGEPNGKIELKVGDQVIASGTVGSDGNYSLTIPKQSAGTVIKAVVSMDGQTSEANTTVVRTALAQTTISEINTETTQVSGKGEPNAPIKIMNGDQIIAQGVVGSDGNYTLTIPRQAKDSVIKAIVEKDGLTSEAQTTVKQGSLAQTTISEINTETTQVSGKGEPNAPIKIMNGDQIIAQGVIGSDGNYTLTIPKQAKDSVIKAIVEKDGLTSKAQTTVTQGSLV
ncbi:Ig-like domain-containing protein, partial [Enterococcus faecium]|uniref:Ig-like domain-containing protein n=1 Tax=Enterococcus faecium TaxID=1352 RepID=UPI0021589941